MLPGWSITKLVPHKDRPEVTLTHKSGNEVVFHVPSSHSGDRDRILEYIKDQCTAHNSLIARFYMFASTLMPKSMRTTVVGVPVHYRLWGAIVAEGLIILSLLVYLGAR